MSVNKSSSNLWLSPGWESLPLLFLVAGCLAFVPVSVAAQGLGAPVQQQEEAVEPQDDEKEPAEEEVEEEIEVPRPVVVVDEQLVQLELWDGSIITGKLQVETLKVDTQFGPLVIPVGKIKKILPGLDSYPEMRSKLDDLVATLSSKNFDERDKAQRELVGMGVMLRDQLAEWLKKGDAEQQKRLKEIIDEVQPMVEELADEGELSGERSLIYKDTVVTEEFTIVGKILTTDYILQTKFGDLKISLADMKIADRTVFVRGADIRKNLEVEAEAFFQRDPLNTRVRVQAGDLISITADGVVNWTNWNQTAGPEGLNGQGAYQGFISGTLLARIGSKGKLIKVGKKASFRATTSGTLYLGIAMQDNYLNRNNNYRWVGEYDVRLNVEAME